jgi:CMP/dCMP kinase
MKEKINIAIDGPVACGKTTVGKRLARRLNYQFLDSGLLFRHFAWFCQKSWTVSNQKDERLNKEEISKLSLAWQEKITSNQQEFVQQLEKLRNVLSSSKISNLASCLAPIPELRKIILSFQRELTREKGWVVVGRDITSAVLLQAEVKIFLTASLEVRVKRRYQERQGKVDPLTVQQELLARDERDKNRPISPLKKTTDSWEIDNTDLSPEESVEKIYQIILKTVWINWLISPSNFFFRKIDNWRKKILTKLNFFKILDMKSTKEKASKKKKNDKQRLNSQSNSTFREEIIFSSF